MGVPSYFAYLIRNHKEMLIKLVPLCSSSHKPKYSNTKSMVVAGRYGSRIKKKKDVVVDGFVEV